MCIRDRSQSRGRLARLLGLREALWRNDGERAWLDFVLTLIEHQYTSRFRRAANGRAGHHPAEGLHRLIEFAQSRRSGQIREVVAAALVSHSADARVASSRSVCRRQEPGREFLPGVGRGAKPLVRTAPIAYNGPRRRLSPARSARSRSFSDDTGHSGRDDAG